MYIIWTLNIMETVKQVASEASHVHYSYVAS